MAKDHVNILGGGPAGASAGLAALSDGALVRVIERPSVIANPFRHKVCGEFFSPEIEPELTKLGVWAAFREANPARVRRMTLHFGSRSKSAPLPEPAWGLSRYRFDALMLNRARTAGAELTSSREAAAIDIDATGRRSTSTVRGKRLFGFKAHFSGPADDAVELFFFNGCYVGVSAIEDGLTNVCGLGPEEELARFAFGYDEVVNQCPGLKARLAPLNRVMPWVSTGPLQFGQKFDGSPSMNTATYSAGDALSFVDPFTGSGLLAAVRSGAAAGRAAARRESRDVYLSRTRADLQTPYRVAALLRRLAFSGWIQKGWAEPLTSLVPAQFLFSLTRPRL